MYEDFYRLTEKPFDLIPDPGKVFMGAMHQEAAAIFRYGVLARKGFLMLTGQVGTGKTTLLHCLAQSLDKHVHLCMIANPTLQVHEFFYLLTTQYGLDDFENNKAKFLVGFSGFLKDCREKGEQVLLVVDEAHALPIELLEEIRLLSNQATAEYGVLSIFLVGQPELLDRLNTERLLPLKQRIAIRFQLPPFTEEETSAYIAFRLRKAGRRAQLFSGQAIRLIHDSCNGNPRLINVVCDHALVTGYAENQAMIDETTVAECLNELDIAGFSPPEKISSRDKENKRLPAVHLTPKALAVGLAIVLLVGTIITISSNPDATQLVSKWSSSLHQTVASTGAILWEKYTRP